MSDVEIIGRAVGEGEARFPSRPDIKKRQEFTLVQAASVSELSIHEMKEAIREKKLAAEWRGRYAIKFNDLVRFMEGS